MMAIKESHTTIKIEPYTFQYKVTAISWYTKKWMRANYQAAVTDATFSSKAIYGFFTLKI